MLICKQYEFGIYKKICYLEWNRKSTYKVVQPLYNGKDQQSSQIVLFTLTL